MPLERHPRRSVQFRNSTSRGPRRALRVPRLAQGAEKTLLLRCAIEGTYQGTTSRKRTGLRADLTVPRPRAARAVQIDFRRSGLKRFKRGAFPRVCRGKLKPSSRAKLGPNCGLGAPRRATARGAVRDSHRAPRKPVNCGDSSRGCTRARHLETERGREQI